MDLATYVRSTDNRDVLRKFCVPKLQHAWPHAKPRIPAIVDLLLDEAVEAVVGPYGAYKHWSLSMTNVGDANVAIWCHLKVAAEQQIKGLEPDPETLLEQMFADKQAARVEDRVDVVQTERVLEAFEDHYANLWK